MSQVDPDRDDKKKVELYQMLVELLAKEDALKETVRRSEDEVQNILNERTREEAASELDISVYDTQRNEKARKHREELERLQEEEKKRRQDLEIDFLAPFLAQMGDPEKINRKQAYQLKEECLADLKQRLIDKANLIQARFEKVSAPSWLPRQRSLPKHAPFPCSSELSTLDLVSFSSELV